MNLFRYLYACLFLLVSFGTNVKAETTCEVLNNSCEYYLCKEMQTPCGGKGYNIDFGYRYCLKYQNDKHYSSQGKDWLYAVRGCLQEKLNELRPDIMCVDLKKQAIASHYQCYIDEGYCELPLADKRRVLRTAATSIFNFDVLLSGLRILRKCAQDGKLVW
ncbi:MAG: hypothetical protein AB8G05_05375 [Oligoflexales bacterium]